METGPPNPVKVLIYNISHSDICLTIQPASVIGVDVSRELICRPRASYFKTVCREILRVLKLGANCEGIRYPDEHGIKRCAGIRFLQPQQICAWHHFRLRDPQKPAISAIAQSSESTMVITRVFFPLISAIMPIWIASHSSNFHDHDHDHTHSHSHSHSHHNIVKHVKRLSFDIGHDNDQDNSSGENSNHHNHNHSNNSNNSNNNSDCNISMNSMNSTNRHRHRSDNGNANTDGQSDPDPDPDPSGPAPVLSIAMESKTETHDDEEEEEEEEEEIVFLSSEDAEDDHVLTQSQLSHHAIKIDHKLFLVSGAGHSLLTGNKQYAEEDSTEDLLKIIHHFMTRFFPFVVVKPFFSGRNIFHYMANIRFVREVLRPAVDVERAQLAAYYGNGWQKTFHLAITLSDGTPARLSSILEGLRTYSPDMFHIWRMKSLWTAYPNIERLWTADVDYLRFDEMETHPPIAIKEIKDAMILALVCEMRQWKHAFIARAITNARSEMADFWLRKSLTPVLAIVAVQKPDESGATFYRGLNMEVSMPTGSLCAERSAIGSALANDPSLRREHFKMIAVLFLPKLSKSKSTTQSSFANLFQNSRQKSEKNEKNNNNQHMNYHYHYQRGQNQSNNNSGHKGRGRGRGFYSPSLKKAVSVPVPSNSAVLSPSSNFGRFSDLIDVNPRGPCGSCEEWLKKIAESNPSFSIITFSSVELIDVIIKKLA